MSDQPVLYFMCKPPVAQQRQACGCRSSLGLDESYTADRLHTTMLRLGEDSLWSPARLDDLWAALQHLVYAPFDVAFDTVERRMLRGRNGIHMAAQFHRALRRCAAMCGVPLPEHDFWLHMSLAYRGPSLERAHKVDPISWRVEDFLLIRSIPRHGHEVLGRWPLHERQYALSL